MSDELKGPTPEETIFGAARGGGKDGALRAEIIRMAESENRRVFLSPEAHWEWHWHRAQLEGRSPLWRSEDERRLLLGLGAPRMLSLRWGGARGLTEITAEASRRFEAWSESDGRDVPLSLLSPEALLFEAEQMVEEGFQQELDELLFQNREGELDEAGRQRLEKMAKAASRGLIRKAQAQALAVRLGLRPPGYWEAR